MWSIISATSERLQSPLVVGGACVTATETGLAGVFGKSRFVPRCGELSAFLSVSLEAGSK